MKAYPVRISLILLIFGLNGPTISAQDWKYLGALDGSQARVDNGFMSCKGKFYLLGGRGIQPVAIYDPDTDIWDQGAAPPVEMHHFQAARLGEELWVLGALTGTYPNERPLEDIYVYNTVEDSWRREATIPQDRQRGAAGVAVYRESIYMIGGTQDPLRGKSTPWVDRYDTKTGKWKKLANAPRARDYFHAGICDGRIYAIAGKSNTETPSFIEAIREVDVFTIESGRWKTLPREQNLPTTRTGNATVMVLDHILVIGGRSPAQETSYSIVEAYDVHSGLWKEWPSMGQGRHGTQAVMCVGSVFIASGKGGNKSSHGLRSLEKMEL